MALFHQHSGLAYLVPCLYLGLFFLHPKLETGELKEEWQRRTTLIPAALGIWWEAEICTVLFPVS